ncbi:MAG: M23 family metallopeptidase [Candidatus Heimdallarchaeota archaeon]|nr:M23 family metallopeptidase [Candidatus Heimdallarchaeota archaeon]
MKKRGKIILLIFSSIVILTGITIPLLPFILQFQPAYGTPVFEFPVAEPLNITRLSAYNTPNWGEPGIFHNGIDLVIVGPTQLISPCFGIVTKIWFNINPYVGGEVAMIHVLITVNYAWSVKLVLEPFANTTEIRERQLELIVTKVGTRVEPGDLVGTLLWSTNYPHLHYMIMKNGDDVNPYMYSSSTAQTIFDEIAERTNSTIYYH